MSNDNENAPLGDVQAAILAGQCLGEPVTLKGTEAYAAVPTGTKLVDLERYGVTPRRRRARVSAWTAETFSAYVLAYRSASAAVFVDPRAARFVAVLDYHAPGADGAPAWGAHRVTLELRETVEWIAWKAVESMTLDQAALAEFVEDHVADIAEPDGATLIEAARALTVTQGSTFVSSIPGVGHTVKVAYTSDERATGPNDVTIPTRLVLGIRPFEGTDKYKLAVRLRVIVTRDGGRPAARFKLARVAPEAVRLDAVNDVRASIVGSLSAASIPVFDGGIGNEAEP